MKPTTKELIKEVAKVIDRDKYNPILTNKDYDKYIEKVLVVLVEEVLRLEKDK